ncbi:Ribosomal protein L6 [Spironucleus salmonicida]|nr:Ribosomal protein L6 [Spironucleus salmonicida]KAH0572941.1 Ribosomal protein L6 [Spironucleus salmonicida]KAH0572955.1 Ribosomal protein L6 [Spironucleus salmonicida]|eukprot:EST43114.1 Ribosomal protein L9 [Spironucleus salmonicida]
MVLKNVCTITIPEGIKCELVGKKVTITGPRGTLFRDFVHTPCELEMVGAEVIVTVWFPKGQQKSLPRTITAHIQNLITGVTKGYLYKMRLAYAHFPISVNIVDNASTIEIRNFLRESEVRKITAQPGVKIEISKDIKDELIITGNDVELVSMFCAQIHESVKIRHKDLRKFLDGIYVSHRGTQ